MNFLSTVILATVLVQNMICEETSDEGWKEVTIWPPVSMKDAYFRKDLYWNNRPLLDRNNNRLRIKTNSSEDSNKQIDVKMDLYGTRVGELKVFFSSPIQYSIRHCQENFTNFPIQPPTEVNKTWEIVKTKELLIIACNGEQLLKYNFSESENSECAAMYRDFENWSTTYFRTMTIPSLEYVVFMTGDNASIAYMVSPPSTCTRTEGTVRHGDSLMIPCRYCSAGGLDGSKAVICLSDGTWDESGECILNSYEVLGLDWNMVTRGVRVGWDLASTPLQIVTNSSSAKDKWDTVQVWMYGVNSMVVGEVELLLSDDLPYRYIRILLCVGGYEEFRIPPPTAGVDEIWTIAKTENNLTVSCNGEVLLDIEYAAFQKENSRYLYDHYNCGDWNLDLVQIEFDAINRDEKFYFYRGFPGCPGLTVPNSVIGTWPDQELNATVSIECSDGYEIDGTEKLTCQSDGTWEPAVIPTCQCAAIPASTYIAIIVVLGVLLILTIAGGSLFLWRNRPFQRIRNTE